MEWLSTHPVIEITIIYWSWRFLELGFPVLYRSIAIGVDRLMSRLLP